MARLECEITHAEVILGGAVRVGIVFNDHSGAMPDVTASQSTMGDNSGR
jgi:hypothetical protein